MKHFNRYVTADIKNGELVVQLDSHSTISSKHRSIALTLIFPVTLEGKTFDTLSQLFDHIENE